MGGTGYRPIQLIRRGLLLALALFLGIVVTLFISKRLATPSSLDTPAESPLDGIADILTSGKGFDYEVTDGDQRLFHISADRVVTDKQNIATLEGIRIKVERDSGDVYELTAESGTYRTETKTAVVEGNVVLTGTNGVELRGRRFDLTRKGRFLTSRGPVRLAVDGRLTGSARELNVHLTKDLYVLSGRVQLQGVAGPMELRADRITYDEPAGMIHAEGGVTLARDRDRMACRRLAVTLSADGSKPAFVRARWDVQGVVVRDDERGFTQRIGFLGAEVSLRYDDAGEEPRLVEIQAPAGGLARLDQEDDTGWVRRVVTPRIVARFRNGVLHRANTARPVTVTEFLSFQPGVELSRTCGADAVLTFDRQGDLDRLELEGRVDLHRPGWQASGDVLEATGGSSSRVTVRGKPASVYTAQGELAAPSIEYAARSGDLEASGGIRAVFPPGGDVALVSTGTESRRRPVELTSEDATWSRADGEFTFVGAVRAWQGESFLTANRLVGEAGGDLTGIGKIKTVLVREPDAGAAAGAPEDNGVAAAAPEAVEGEAGGEVQSGEGLFASDAPVEVTAGEFRYQRRQGRVHYTDSPKMRQAGRLMECSDLEVFLGEDSDLDRLVCRTNVLIDDPQGGHKVRGREAVYRPEDSSVTVTGSPVTLERPNGMVVRGQTVVYDLERAEAELQSAGSAGLETESATSTEAESGVGPESAGGDESSQEEEGTRER